ncbi:N amino acid transport system protein [Microdochium trichocladiopsis]|uniref:N amino acid transport system protein n=1 Tax=Microdochium trichocladiopsis TaxID=1682393 RepID=A0A9P9BMM9_9PEZI|nr:N amino acid transport system protein [Microdochium trichocladiopsis]KAH7026440.1 N amino acid transport system protein [Microdochium trichocladiopsis]
MRNIRECMPSRFASEARIVIRKQKALAGDAHFHRMGWRGLALILIVEAVALGALSLPQCFAVLGIVAGTIVSVVFGLLAIVAGHNVGALKCKFPHVRSYADAGAVLFGKMGFAKAGYEFVYAVFLLELIFVSGSHCLTGTIAFNDLTNKGACGIVFGVVSAIILFAVSAPASFADMAFLSFVDFASIIAAIGITIIATGIQANQAQGGLSAVNWSWAPKENVSPHEVFVAVVNIILAYTFTLCQFSFMDEMHTPETYGKAVWTAGLAEIVIYTLTGTLVYAFVGADVESPALLSGGPTISKIAFGVALPVIFISGAVITQTAARLVHGRIFANRVERYVNTPRGWITWLLTVFVIVAVGWVIAEAIPFFSNLVALISSLFNSGFALYLPALMWFTVLREGPWTSRENLMKGFVNGLMLVSGVVVLVGGTWASIQSIIDDYREGAVGGSFTCS